LISQIITNPGTFQEDGILRVNPFHKDGHSCRLCPQNLCKGLVLRDIVEESGTRELIQQIVYVGDGSGDYCPTHNLLSQDIICCRQDWSLHRKLQKYDSLVAQLKPWNNGQDILRTFNEIFN